MLLRPIGERERIIGQDFHSESAQDFRRDSSDFSSAENAGGFAMKIETDEAVEGKVKVVHTIARARDFAIEREEERDRVLGDRVRGIGGNACDRETKLLRGHQINAVE